MGGTDDPSNIIELTIEEHAEAHRKLFEEHGRWQDELAWKGLAKMISREEIIRIQITNGAKNAGKKRMSSMTLKCSKAQNFPVRPKPVCTSSKINKTPY